MPRFIYTHLSLLSQTPQQLTAWISVEIKHSRRGQGIQGTSEFIKFQEIK